MLSKATKGKNRVMFDAWLYENQTRRLSPTKNGLNTTKNAGNVHGRIETIPASQRKQSGDETGAIFCFKQQINKT